GPALDKGLAANRPTPDARGLSHGTRGDGGRPTHGAREGVVYGDTGQAGNGSLLQRVQLWAIPPVFARLHGVSSWKLPGKVQSERRTPLSNCPCRAPPLPEGKQDSPWNRTRPAKKFLPGTPACVFARAGRSLLRLTLRPDRGTESRLPGD